MRRLPQRILVPMLFAAAAAWGCGSDTTTPPLTPTPAPTTEQFSGDLNRNNATTHPFTVTGTGSVTATLTTVAPDSTIAIGMALGTWNGTSCQVIIANDRAIQGITVTGATSGVGALCLRMYDIGQLTDTASYTVTVVHP